MAGNAENGQPKDRLPSPADAVADMRSTARWTIAAAAAVAALLLGGAPLTAVGKIDHLGNALLAYLGLVIALGGVGWAIWQTGEALMPRVATLADLDDPELADLRATMAKDPVAFYGPFQECQEEWNHGGGRHGRKEPGAFHGPYHDGLRRAAARHGVVAANLAVKAAAEEDPARSRMLAQALEDARANAELAERLQRQLVEFVHAWKVRTAVRRARVHTLAAAAVIALGAVLFLSATHETATPTAPSSPASPTPSARH
jgi:hypothetical protein